MDTDKHLIQQLHRLITHAINESDLNVTHTSDYDAIDPTRFNRIEVLGQHSGQRVTISIFKSAPVVTNIDELFVEREEKGLD